MKNIENQIEKLIQQLKRQKNARIAIDTLDQLKSLLGSTQRLFELCAWSCVKGNATTFRHFARMCFAQFPEDFPIQSFQIASQVNESKQLFLLETLAIVFEWCPEILETHFGDLQANLKNPNWENKKLAFHLLNRIEESNAALTALEIIEEYFIECFSMTKEADLKKYEKWIWEGLQAYHSQTFYHYLIEKLPLIEMPLQGQLIAHLLIPYIGNQPEAMGLLFELVEQNKVSEECVLESWILSDQPEFAATIFYRLVRYEETHPLIPKKIKKVFFEFLVRHQLVSIAEAVLMANKEKKFSLNAEDLVILAAIQSDKIVTFLLTLIENNVLMEHESRAVANALSKASHTTRLASIVEDPEMPLNFQALEALCQTNDPDYIDLVLSVSPTYFQGINSIIIKYLSQFDTPAIRTAFLEWIKLPSSLIDHSPLHRFFIEKQITEAVKSIRTSQKSELRSFLPIAKTILALGQRPDLSFIFENHYLFEEETFVNKLLPVLHDSVEKFGPLPNEATLLHNDRRLKYNHKDCTDFLILLSLHGPNVFERYPAFNQIYPGKLGQFNRIHVYLKYFLLWGKAPAEEILLDTLEKIICEHLDFQIPLEALLASTQTISPSPRLESLIHQNLELNENARLESLQVFATHGVMEGPLQKTRCIWLASYFKNLEKDADGFDLVVKALQKTGTAFALSLASQIVLGEKISK
jgi:hypothetical protein